MGNTFYFSWEPALMAWLQANMGGFLTAVSRISTLLGSEKVLVAVLGFFYLCRDKKTGVSAGINVSLSLVLGPMIKNLACRRRPYFDLEGVECLVPVDASADLYDVTAQGWSFPSGHSANSAAIYGSFLSRAKSNLPRTLCALLIILIGVSRVAVGCHYPSDVIGGWLLACLIFLLIPRLRRLMPDKRKFYAAVFLVSSAGCLWCRTDDYYSGLGIMAGVFCADLFEERFVNFENTRVPLYCVLRLAGGLAVFLGLSALIKLPFSGEFLASPVPAAFLLRTLRYAVSVFVSLGIYPMSFAKVEKKKGEVIR